MKIHQIFWLFIHFLIVPVAHSDTDSYETLLTSMLRSLLRSVNVLWSSMWCGGALRYQQIMTSTDREEGWTLSGHTHTLWIITHIILHFEPHIYLCVWNGLFFLDFVEEVPEVNNNIILKDGRCTGRWSSLPWQNLVCFCSVAAFGFDHILTRACYHHVSHGEDTVWCRDPERIGVINLFIL